MNNSTPRAEPASRSSRLADWPWVLVAFLGAAQAAYALVLQQSRRIAGLSPASIRYFDLRPFPLPGGTNVQAVALWCVPLGCLVACILGVTALLLMVAKAVWDHRRSVGPRVPWLRVQRGAALLSVVIATPISILTTLYVGANLERPSVVASLRGVERMAGVQFPAGSRLVEAQGYSGWYGGLRAVVLVPPGEVSGLLDGPPFGEKPWARAAVHDRWSTWPDDSPLAAWKAGKVAHPLRATGAEWDGGDASIWRAVADLSDGEMATLYLEWDRH